MVRDQPPARLIRPTDVALTAGGVALLAVILKGRGQWGALFQITTPGFKNRLKATEGGMETEIMLLVNILVTGITTDVGRVG